MAFAKFLAWDVCGETVYVVGNLALGRWANGWLGQSWFAAAFWGLVALATVLPALVTLERWLRKRRHPGERAHALLHQGNRVAGGPNRPSENAKWGKRLRRLAGSYAQSLMPCLLGDARWFFFGQERGTGSSERAVLVATSKTKQEEEVPRL